MKKLALVTAIAAASWVSPAGAQDFEGFRAEGHAGIEWSDANLDFDNCGRAFEINTDDSGFIFGAGVGYDFQVSNGFILGVEGNVSFPQTESCGIANAADRICASLDTEFNIAARAGARLGSDFLVYGKIGYTNLGSEIAYTDLNGVLPSVAEGNDADGILFGAGLEFNLGNGPYAKLEYRYADYENRGESSNGNIIDFGITRSQVMAGLGWRF